MPILNTELKLFKAAQISNTAASNGGRASYNEVVSAVNNNLFPDISQAERIAGATHFRKAFFKNANADNLTLFNPKLFVENYSPADDALYFHVGDHTNLQSALTGTEDLYGCGKLDSTVSAGAGLITVLLEDPTVQFFKNGQKIRISDRATIGGAGNEEFVTIDGAPSLAGSVVTLNITPALQNGYDEASTRVANVYEPADLATALQNFVVSTVGSGDYDSDSLSVPNVGGVYDDWTITFTSANTFTCVGAREGAMAAGSSLSNYSPNNPGTSTPFFTLLSAGFSGAWQAGDTITFRTVPAHVPLWAKRIAPAGAGAYAGNKAVIAIDGETA